MKSKRSKQAFTLIELLVVISIIALLVSILMPALGKARELAKRSVCLSNQKQLSYAWILYAEDNDDLMCSPCPGWRDEDLEISWIYWAGSGFPNTWSEDLWDESIMNGALWPYCSESLEVFRCPTGKENEKITYSAFPAMGWREDLGRAIEGDIYTKISQIPSPSSRSVFIDEGYLTTNFYGVTYNAPTWFDQPPGRHNLGATLSFADSHAEYWKWQDDRTIEMCQMTWEDYRDTWKGVDCPDNVDLSKMRRAAWGDLTGGE